MAKPMLVTLPLVLLLMDFWPLGRLERPSQPRIPRQAPARRGAGQEEIEEEKTAETAGNRLGATSAGNRSPHLLLTEKIPLVVRLRHLRVFITLYAQHTGGCRQLPGAYPLGDGIANALVSYSLYLCQDGLAGQSGRFLPLCQRHPRMAGPGAAPAPALP